MLRLEAVKVVQGAFSLDANLSVAAGQRVAVIGPSGSGKSTLLNVVAGFVDLTQGRIFWDGVQIDGVAPHARPIGFVFQDNNLFPHLTVAQNVGLGIAPKLRLSDAQTVDVENALARVGLGGMGARKPSELSGGQQSRVALARLVLSRAPLVLLDEPFAALGPALKVEMMDLLVEVLVETGAAMLMVTHDPQDARHIADQVILVIEGVADAPVATDALFANPPAALAAYLG
ncbi:ATP-binding cassette domain-containing protein [Thalassobium sp. R2A62]|jgi:thiamine transport system ATP-binding protein|uniref:thiamine ABC transporter ATP-binding protein n=1 Tax=Thalassobium sp. R2A62 TaxID=633131 RepID=UPI0001B1CD45|nr:ATP-binding cassette domain-containing protein [Thalassobium sp. R2A62]EET47768.1 thiamine import ATP-binding protein ThiQ [Thalassobium sp. R2A62]MDG1340783.1 ATP-binding cassette domain-containing protein [Paracoccaceae bacterium]MDG2453151.1 ATP-binding cassette domain-containing protein [Paracoccaceae bacterium]